MNNLFHAEASDGDDHSNNENNNSSNDENDGNNANLSNLSVYPLYMKLYRCTRHISRNTMCAKFRGRGLNYGERGRPK